MSNSKTNVVKTSDAVLVKGLTDEQLAELKKEAKAEIKAELKKEAKAKDEVYSTKTKWIATTTIMLGTNSVDKSGKPYRKVIGGKPFMGLDNVAKELFAKGLLIKA